MPCGRCRQVLYEFGGPDCLVDTPRGGGCRCARCCPTPSARSDLPIRQLSRWARVRDVHAVDVIRPSGTAGG